MAMAWTAATVMTDCCDQGGSASVHDEYGRPLYLTPCPYCGECCGGISCRRRYTLNRQN